MEVYIPNDENCCWTLNGWCTNILCMRNSDQESNKKFNITYLFQVDYWYKNTFWYLLCIKTAPKTQCLHRSSHIYTSLWSCFCLLSPFALRFNWVLIINYMKYILQIHCLLDASTKAISFPKAGISKVFDNDILSLSQTKRCHMTSTVDTKCCCHKYHLFCCSFKILKSITSILLRWVNQW